MLEVHLLMPRNYVLKIIIAHCPMIIYSIKIGTQHAQVSKFKLTLVLFKIYSNKFHTPE
jgi:hypothetical protein